MIVFAVVFIVGVAMRDNKAMMITVGVIMAVKVDKPATPILISVPVVDNHNVQDGDHDHDQRRR
jgi:hypothetical protein